MVLSAEGGSGVGLSISEESLKRWQPAPADRADCAQAELHLFRIPLHDRPVHPEESWADLTIEERQRADRYVVEPPRRRFRYCRRTVRRCLGWLTGVEPNALSFGVEQNGKPTLAYPADTDLAFNVSHSGDWGVLAVGWNCQIGVDLETIDPHLDITGLATRFFSDREQHQLFQLPAERQRAGFYHIWTSKEAYMKAVGLGMALPLASFHVAANPDQPPALLAGDVGHGPWHAVGFHVASAVPGTLMFNQSREIIRYWDIPQAWQQPME